MAEFPQRENDVISLARDLIAGLRDNRDEFPAPPVEPDRIEAVCEEFAQARDRAMRARVAAKRATKEKGEVLKRLKSDMKSGLRYAEYRTGFDDRRLGLIGWGAHRPDKPLQPPGQVADLRIFQEGRDWIALDWDPPPKELGKGRVRAYRVERAPRGADEWAHVGLALESSIMLKNQERGVEWQYRVIAVNREGEGMESNVVTAVL